MPKWIAYGSVLPGKQPKEQIIIPSKRSRVIANSILIFCFLTVVGGGVIYLIDIVEHATTKEILQERDRQEVKATSTSIISHLSGARSDLAYLTRCASLRRFLSGDASALAEVQQDFLAFAQSKPVYDQVRYIDASGTEVVRINQASTESIVVPDENLQDKSRRYYFAESFAFPKGRVFVSPLDLNVEKGKVEVPLKPMIRFGLSVFDSDGNRQGVVLLNYLAQNLLDEISQDHLMLLNRDGFWLGGGPPEHRFAFMFGSDTSFASTYPELWTRLLEDSEKQSVSGKGILTFHHIYPLDPDMGSSSGADNACARSSSMIGTDGYVWHVVAFRSSASLRATLRNIDRVLLSIFGGWVVVSLLIAILLSDLLERRRIHQENQSRLDRMRGVLETAGAVCHEINQPLTGLIGYANMLLEDETLSDEDTRRRLARLLQSGERISEITRRLQSVVRYETKEYVGGERILDLEASAQRPYTSSEQSTSKNTPDGE